MRTVSATPRAGGLPPPFAARAARLPREWAPAGPSAGKVALGNDLPSPASAIIAEGRPSTYVLLTEPEHPRYG